MAVDYLFTKKSLARHIFPNLYPSVSAWSGRERPSFKVEIRIFVRMEFILLQNLNISFRIFCSAGLIVEKTGNYVYAFYMTGGVLFAAFLIPMVLIVISRKRSRVNPMDPKETVEAVIKV